MAKYFKTKAKIEIETDDGVKYPSAISIDPLDGRMKVAMKIFANISKDGVLVDRNQNSKADVERIEDKEFVVSITDQIMEYLANKDSYKSLQMENVVELKEKGVVEREAIENPVKDVEKPILKE